MSGLYYMFLGVFLVVALNWLWTRHASFLGQTPDDYSNDGEAFDLRNHLNGIMLCEGVIYGPFGRVNSRFVGEFDCKWEGSTGVMMEEFCYDDGTIMRRGWHLTLSEDGRITATAPDVIGEGKGVQAGPSVQLKYRIQLAESAGGHVLDAVDWMYLTPNGTIVNRSQFRKYGIQVAELVATMRAVEPAMKKAA